MKADPLKKAIPYIFALSAVELIVNLVDAEDRRDLIEDTMANGAHGLSAMVVSEIGKAALAAPSVWLYETSPWKFDVRRKRDWLILFVGVDLTIYVQHRMSHMVRILWAGHQVHHSSDHMNTTIAYRRKWAQWFEKLSWMPLAAVGFPPKVISAMHAYHLLYGVFAHSSKRIKFPAVVEYFLVTPSHHRVHHGVRPIYIDKNFGSFFIVWDRMFGTFQALLEDEPEYGVTKPIRSKNIVTQQTIEFRRMIEDVRSATRLQHKLKYVFGRPGYRHSV